jgi:hypothetical protein
MTLQDSVSRLLLSFCFPGAIDLLSCYLAVKRNHGGRGASGFPLVTLFLYGILVSQAEADWPLKALFFALALFIHVTLLFLIPYLDSRYFCKK